MKSILQVFLCYIAEQFVSTLALLVPYWDLCIVWLLLLLVNINVENVLLDDVFLQPKPASATKLNRPIN